MRSHKMTPSRRKPVNKVKSAKQFRRNIRKVKGANVGPMRGGFRF